MLVWAREVEISGLGEGEEVVVGMDMFLGETFRLGWGPGGILKSFSVASRISLSRASKMRLWEDLI